MANPSAKSCLDPNQHRLICEMQRLRFGRIENLHVRDGLPVFDPAPRLVREIKLGGGQNEPRPEVPAEEHPRKSRLLDLFDQLHRLRDGLVLRLEVKHGLPLWLQVEEQPRG